MRKVLCMACLAAVFASGWFVRGVIAERDMTEFQMALAKSVEKQEADNREREREKNQKIIDDFNRVADWERESAVLLERVRRAETDARRARESSKYTHEQLRGELESCQGLLARGSELAARCGSLLGRSTLGKD